MSTSTENISDRERTCKVILRAIRVSQPVSQAEVAERTGLAKTAVAAVVEPLIARGILGETAITGSGGRGRKPKGLAFSESNGYLIAVNIGVRLTQVGMVDLAGEDEEHEFETPSNREAIIRNIKQRIEDIRGRHSEKQLKMIGVSVPGMTDPERTSVIYAPNLGWTNVDLRKEFDAGPEVHVIVENDATAAALFEARLRCEASGRCDDFVLVRSGTGIGVSLVTDSEVRREPKPGHAISGEFGHMTISAGGKPCVCGNRGCWEKYASAASAASLYLGDRPLRRGESMPRFIEIVTKAKNGEIRARRTLEWIGDYVGIGIANILAGFGVPQRVVISGRLVHGWDFIKEPLNQAIERSIVGKTKGWSVEKGDPYGAAFGGAVEVAVEEYFSLILSS